MSILTISNDELRGTIEKALASVFKTMLEYHCELESFEDVTERKGEIPKMGEAAMDSVHVGSVGFVGTVNGMIYLYMKTRFVETAAERITGLGEDDLDPEMVSDTCGELSNMFGGTLARAFAQLGYESVLTLPSVLSGEEIVISTFGVKRHLRSLFKVNGERVIVDLVLADSP